MSASRMSRVYREFYIFIIIYPEIQSFGPVINFRTDNLIGKIKIKTVINIQK